MAGGLGDVLHEFDCIEVEPRSKRDTCQRCSRPVTACWCAYLPRNRVSPKTTVYVLQHPYEEKRRLKTAPMLQCGMEQGKCHILVGKRFSLDRYPEFKNVTEDENTLLLFPTEEAVDLQDYIDTVPDYNKRAHSIIILDGTWLLAKGIYFKNPFLQKLKQVKVSHSRLSEYVIRTQPTDSSLSTLESAAMAISMLDNKPDIFDVLVQPLRAMCDIQRQHGAVVHQSKEYLIKNGLYKKQEPKPGNQKKDRKKHESPTTAIEGVD